MLTKNDGDTIKSSLESVKSIAHEIVVVDIGSSDNTLQEIKKFEESHNIPCKIINHVWDNHFGKARNLALKNSSCHWILMMEPHEKIKKADLAQIKSLIVDDNYVGYYLHKQAEMEGIDPDKNSLKKKKHNFIPELRLFRNHEQIKYDGVIYESVEKSLHAVGQSFKTSIFFE